MLFFLLILKLKNPNTGLYNCMDLNASSMSESLAISVSLEWKIYNHFFSDSLRLILSKL